MEPAPALASLPCCALAELQPPPVPSMDDWAASNAWLERAVNIAKQQVSSLFAYFRLNKREDQTVMVMSIKDNFLAAAFPLPRRRDAARSSLAAAAAAPDEAGAGGEDGGSSGDEGEGESEVHARNRSLALQTTYLYYGVLLHALRKLYPMVLPPGVNATSRFAKPTVAASDVPKVCHLLSIPVFHTSLLTVACMVTRAIADRDPTCLGATPDLFLRIPQAAGFAPNMMALWNAARWYQEAFVTMPLSSAPLAADGAGSSRAGTSEPPGPAVAAAGSAADAQLMPALPGRFVLGRLMRICEERGVLAEGSTVYCILTEGAAGGYTEGDSALLNVFLQSYARRATATVERMAAVAVQQLVAAARTAGEAPHPHQHLLSELAAELMDQVMCTRLELCFNQHVSVLAACCLYSVAKALKLRLPFSSVTRAFLTHLPDHPADLFDRQVELQPAGVSGGSGAAGGGAAVRSLAARAAAAASAAGGGSAAEGGGAAVERSAVMGDIRAFYNQSFLPAMEGTVRSLVRTRTTGAASIATAGPIPPMPSCAAAPAAASVAAQALATGARRHLQGHEATTVDTSTQRDTNVRPANATTVAAAEQPAAAEAAAPTAPAPVDFAFPSTLLSAAAGGAGGLRVAAAQEGGLHSATELAGADEAADAEHANLGDSATPNSDKQQPSSGVHSVASLREWDNGRAAAGKREGAAQALGVSGATSAVARERPPPRATRRTTAPVAGVRSGQGRSALSVLPDEEEDGGEGEATGDGGTQQEHSEAVAGAENGSASGAQNRRHGRTSGAASAAAKPGGGLGILRLLRPPPANAAPTGDPVIGGVGGKRADPKQQGARNKVDTSINNGGAADSAAVKLLLARPPRPTPTSLPSPRASPTPMAFVSVQPQQQDPSAGVGGASVVGEKENLRAVAAGKKADEYGFEDVGGAAAAAAAAAMAGGRRRASTYR
ncbi:hypothetical protein HXX76_007835 [Chlamydomonas incerta]|uniref:Uncharacterized protein n=1 Tax=Chlamydomonas incerta TaxID=51695 RepID=A0A835SW00_CHLIN|nr:hypothetical protein HXX76_007835 [Chlamydomonas incerta]|eukprot:KAG2434108.1 hypothetical protein HXX76_007835 [Chlamydomonas incerta]